MWQAAIEAVREVRAAVRSYTSLCLSAGEDPDDVAQDVLLRSLEAGHGVIWAQAADRRRYAHRAVYTTALDARRKAMRRMRLRDAVETEGGETEHPSPEWVLMARERLMEGRPSAVPPSVRRLMSGATMTQIAREEGVSTSTISRRVKRELRSMAFDRAQLRLFGG